VPKYRVLKQARMLEHVFRPVEIADLDGEYHAFIVRYSGDYVTHRHRADEFIYILEGLILMEIGGEQVEVRQGEALLVPAGTPHRARCRNMALALVVEKKGLQHESDPR
jgi:mannose-6-phosphate isomerase-like protein (cupin superfamily)